MMEKASNENQLRPIPCYVDPVIAGVIWYTHKRGQISSFAQVSRVKKKESVLVFAADFATIFLSLGNPLANTT